MRKPIGMVIRNRKTIKDGVITVSSNLHSCTFLIFIYGISHHRFSSLSCIFPHFSFCPPRRTFRIFHTDSLDTINYKIHVFYSCQIRIQSHNMSDIYFFLVSISFAPLVDWHWLLFASNLNYSLSTSIWPIFLDCDDNL